METDVAGPPRNYAVAGPAGDLLFEGVTARWITPRGELVLKGAGDALIAAFAAGHWWHVRLTDETAA